MARQRFVSNPRVNQIFDELENYLRFCQEYGYVYSEAHLGKMQEYSWQQYQKFCQNKNFRDQWTDDARKMNPSVEF
jgi:hypothetical protein